MLNSDLIDQALSLHQSSYKVPVAHRLHTVQLVGGSQAALLICSLYTYIYSALTGGNSHLSGPKYGVVVKIPKLFLTGLENEQSVALPRDDSHAGLIIVTPKCIVSVREKYVEKKSTTFHPNVCSLHNFMKDNIIRRWSIGKNR